MTRGAALTLLVAACGAPKSPGPSHSVPDAVPAAAAPLSDAAPPTPEVFELRPEQEVQSRAGFVLRYAGEEHVHTPNGTRGMRDFTAARDGVTEELRVERRGSEPYLAEWAVFGAVVVIEGPDGQGMKATVHAPPNPPPLSDDAARELAIAEGARRGHARPAFINVHAASGLFELIAPEDKWRVLLGLHTRRVYEYGPWDPPPGVDRQYPMRTPPP